VPTSDLRLLAFDTDGVLTDGRLYYGPAGDDLKVFDVRDGIGIKMLLSAGVQCAFLSGRASEAVGRRAGDLGVAHFVTGIEDKAAEFRKLVESLGLQMRQAGYVGDDLTDLAPMRLAGWSACPADAAPEVRGAVDYVARAPGGGRVAREIAELILKERGEWEAALAALDSR